MAFDLDTVRKEFPILTREIDGKPIVYLDSGNTSQKPHRVIDTMTDFLENTVSPAKPPKRTKAPAAPSPG